MENVTEQIGTHKSLGKRRRCLRGRRQCLRCCRRTIVVWLALHFILNLQFHFVLAAERKLSAKLENVNFIVEMRQDDFGRVMVTESVCVSYRCHLIAFAT